MLNRHHQFYSLLSSFKPEFRRARFFLLKALIAEMNAGTGTLVPALRLLPDNCIFLPFSSQVQPMASRAQCLHYVHKLGLLGSNFCTACYKWLPAAKLHLY